VPAAVSSGGVLAGKVAVVTGAGTGIGAAITRCFAGEGAAVVVAEVEEENGARVADEIAGNGGASLFVQTDVGDHASVSNLAARVIESYSRVDILVNNAATIFGKRLIDHTPEEWRQVFAVIVDGTFHACKAFIPHMIASGGGRVVNIGSISGVVGLPEQGAYCAAKGALHQMTRQLAVDHAADGIRVNAVCPSAVTTRALTRFFEGTANPEATRAAVLASLPVGRFCEPDEVAAAALFFASDASDYATGSIFMFDGGYTAV
jgi:NAD(P)-dependent dehydrogenase (short-subunit alcohol dehydrogenase family)